jgi:hypothetical protein
MSTDRPIGDIKGTVESGERREGQPVALGKNVLPSAENPLRIGVN